MKKTISVKELREFGIIVGLGLPFVFGFAIPKITGHDFREWTLWLGVFFLLLCFFKPKLLNPFYKFWMAFGHLLGRVNSNIILFLVFVFVLMPISIIMKIFGYDPLRLKENKRKTYRIDNKNNTIDLTRIF